LVTDGAGDVLSPGTQASVHDREARDLWDEEIHPDTLASWQEFGPGFQHLLAVVKRMDGLILDVGTGNGFNLMPLAAAGANRWIAFDISGESVRLARRRSAAWQLEQRQSFLMADASILPFADATFDGVMGVGVLHHLTPSMVTQALGEAHRVLKAGGECLFVEPIEDCRWFDRLQTIVKRLCGDTGQDPDRVLTTGELSAAARPFAQTDLLRFGLLLRLTRWFPSRRCRAFLCWIDRLLLWVFPPFRALAATAVLQCRK